MLRRSAGRVTVRALSEAAPVLSIVTPCLNRAGHLPRTLRSVVVDGATEGRVEHIIVDGGSTDGSVEIIRRHAEANPGLVPRWASEPDRGQSHAINKGLAWARGEFGAWLNADDWYAPGALEEVVARLEADRSIDVLVGRADFVEESGRVIFEAGPPGPVTVASLLRLKSVWFNGGCLVQPAVFFRTSVFRELGGLNEANHFSMDFELWLKMAERGARFHVIPRVLAHVGVHAGQKTADNRELVRSMLAVSRAALDRVAVAPGSNAAQSELDSMRRKLAAGDALVARWTAPTAAAPSCATTPPEPPAAPPELVEAWRTLGVPSCGRMLASVARRHLFRRNLRVLSIGHPGVRLCDAVRARFARAEVDEPEAVEAAFLSDGVYDIAVTHMTLLRYPDPAAFVSVIWRAIRPGGWLIQLLEPRRTASLEPYLDAVGKRLASRLSANDEIILDPGADPFIILTMCRDPAAGPSLPDPWSAAYPSARGIDMQDVMRAVDPGAAPARILSFGRFDFHPLAPFPTLKSAGKAASADAWCSSAWRKPR